MSPCLAGSRKDSPAMFVAVGEERLTGLAKLIAQGCAQDGEKEVRRVQYEGMPYCWPFQRPETRQTGNASKIWGEHIGRLWITVGK